MKPLLFAVGVEDTFVPQGFPGRRKLDEYELTQHYRFWREDLDLAAETGATMIRWGVPWHRIEPEPGKFRWDWLDRVVSWQEGIGLTCVVDLMRHGTPPWLSVLDPEYPTRVAAYASALAHRYRDRWRWWTPLNEPVLNAVHCGETGVWPPHRTGQEGFTAVVVALAEGVCRTQRAIAEIQPDATFVHAEAGLRYAGDEFPLPLPELLERRFAALDLVTGSTAPWQWLRSHGASADRLEWFAENAVRPDIVGVNYYPAYATSRYVDGTAQPVYAGTEGLEDLLRTYHARYRLPLAVTATSRAGTVEERLDWLRDSVALVHRLRGEGLPVVGYTWWPLFALVDWLYRDSDEPVEHWLVQMGLADLARDVEGTLLRRRTRLVDAFHALATDA